MVHAGDCGLMIFVSLPAPLMSPVLARSVSSSSCVYNVQLLIGHITTSILKYVGGEGKGEELVGAYMKKFGKMHS